MENNLMLPKMRTNKRKKKAKKIKLIYKQAKSVPKEEAQNGIDRAFDILFEEVAKKP